MFPPSFWRAVIVYSEVGAASTGALVLLGGLLVGLTSSTWVDAASLIRPSAVLWHLFRRPGRPGARFRRLRGAFCTPLQLALPLLGLFQAARVFARGRRTCCSYHVVGHGSSGTIRTGGIPCAPFVPASELRACGDAAAAGRLAGCDAYDGDRKASASVSN